MMKKTGNSKSKLATELITATRNEIKQTKVNILRSSEISSGFPEIIFENLLIRFTCGSN
jgi:hypothetical protein